MFNIRDIGNGVPYLGLRFPKTGVSGPGAGGQLRSRLPSRVVDTHARRCLVIGRSQIKRSYLGLEA